MLYQTLRRCLHSKYTIIGSGDAGKSIASLLIRKKVALPQEIRMIDPVDEYIYQSGLTLVGGGIKQLNNIKTPKKYQLPSLIDKVFEEVDLINPEENSLITKDGKKFTYDNLIIATGTIPTPTRIEGLQEALDDPKCPVGSIYLPKYAIKFNEIRKKLTSKMSESKKIKAVFTQPLSPIKCGGAPQKILHLSWDSWKNEVLLDVDYEFRTGTPKIFPSDHYIQALTEELVKKNTKIHTNSELIRVDGLNRTATFKNLVEDTEETVNFDILHATPICVPPEFISKSGLAAPNGYANVNIYTLQHEQYKNIWALGDSANLPTSKTSSAVNSQIWTLLSYFKNGVYYPETNYRGYTACPVLTGNKKVMLCEFEYKGKPRNSFYFFDNRKPRFFYYLLKTVIFDKFSLHNSNSRLALGFGYH